MIWPSASWQAWTIASVAVLAVLGAGGALTTIGPWYKALRAPSWQPPKWLFGPAWTVIGLVMIYAAVSGLVAATTALTRGLLIALLATNGALNVLWSFLFFKRQRPDWALIEVALLWLSCLAIVFGFAAVSTPAAWAAVVYVSWVSFAALLNREVVRLNDFPSRA